MTKSGAGLSGLTFDANTNNSVATNTVTLTNTGSTVESNFALILPTYFSVSAADGASPCHINGDTITSSLAASGGECTFKLTYTNSVVTSQRMANLGISYTYNNNQTAEATFPLTYQTTQAEAVLQILPSSVNFGSIFNNGTQRESQVVTITNTGTAKAESISAMSLVGYAQFTTTSNNCPGSGILEVGESCAYTFNFGPDNSGSNTGLESATASFTYLPYAEAQTSESVTINLTGTILAPGAANMEASITVNGFAGGDGESPSTAYLIQSGSAATISISYTNTGNYPAESFYTSYNALISQGNSWTDISHGCVESSNITLESNNSSSTCTDTVGTAKLPEGLVAVDQTVSGANIWMFWTDQVGTHSQENPNLPPVYVNVYAPPSISYAITSPQNESTFNAESNHFTITATLTGGYEVQATTITASSIPAGISLNHNSCQVSSTNSTCEFIATVESNATTCQNCSINFSNDSSITQANNSVNFNIQLDTYLAIGYTGDLKVYGGLNSQESGIPIYESFMDCYADGACTDGQYDITSIVIDNNNLYAAQNYYGYVYRVTDFNTGTPVESYNKVNYFPDGQGVTSMLVANNTLYVGVINKDSSEFYIYKLENASTQDPNLLTNNLLSSSSGGASSLTTVGTLAMVNNKLYAGVWPDDYFSAASSNPSALFSYDGTSWSNQISFNTRPVASVVDSNGNIYFATQGRTGVVDPQIIRYNTNGTSGIIFDPNSSSNNISAMVINSDGTKLYFIYNNQVCELATDTQQSTTSCAQVGEQPFSQDLTLLAIDRNDVLYEVFSDTLYYTASYIYTYDTKSTNPSWTEFMSPTDGPISAITAY